MESLAGPISLPMPLVGPVPIKQEMPILHHIPAAPPPPTQPVVSLGSIDIPVEATVASVPAVGPFIKQEPETITLSSVPLYAPPPAPIPKKLAGPPKQSVCAGDPSFWAQPSFDYSDLDYEAVVIGVILSQIGDRPVKPSRPGVNPFLLFTKDKWDECKAYCAKDKNTVGRDAIRSTLGRWWKAASEEDKQPYLVQSQTAQELADAIRKDWATKATKWDIDAQRIREDYMREHPVPQGGGAHAVGSSSMDGVGVSKRKTNVSNCVVLDHA